MEQVGYTIQELQNAITAALGEWCARPVEDEEWPDGYRYTIVKSLNLFDSRHVVALVAAVWDGYDEEDSASVSVEELASSVIELAREEAEFWGMNELGDEHSIAAGAAKLAMAMGRRL